MEIVIEKMTPERCGDFFDFFEKIAFADHPEWGCDCYCCFFHAASRKEWHAREAAENREIARQMIMNGKLRGLLAYAGGVPAGWCHYDRKADLPGLKAFYPKVFSKDDPNQAGAIVCFTVAQGYRGKGVASRLLEAACKELSELGLDVAEAYPGRNARTNEEHYHGPLDMYLAQGFSIIREAGTQWVVRKELGKSI
jgi:ribosomal protein S18 acetylase RimI-like enzyme